MTYFQQRKPQGGQVQRYRQMLPIHTRHVRAFQTNCWWRLASPKGLLCAVYPKSAATFLASLAV